MPDITAAAVLVEQGEGPSADAVVTVTANARIALTGDVLASRGSVSWAVELHLKAYTLDKDPRHLVEACLAFTRAGMPVPVNMASPLAEVLHRLDDKFPKGSGFRKVLIERQPVAEYGRIPDEVSPRTLDTIARTHYKGNRSAASMAISRLRETN